MYGCAGSDTIGPGPLGGGMNSSSWSCHPVRLLGAKFGTFAASAPSAGPNAAPAHIKLARRPLTSEPTTEAVKCKFRHKPRLVTFACLRRRVPCLGRVVRDLAIDSLLPRRSIVIRNGAMPQSQTAARGRA